MSAGHQLDANVILRFLLADDPAQSPKARALFELAQTSQVMLAISHVTLAEVCWVLVSYYDFERSKVARTLRELVLHEGVEVEDGDVILDAFDRFAKVKVDFIDCYMAALAKAHGSVVITDDRDFRKFADVTARRPEEIVREFTK